MHDDFDDELVPQSRRRSGRSRRTRRSDPEVSQCAIASLILGGLSIPFTCLIFIGPILAIGAIVFGHIAIGQINGSRGRLTGKGIAFGGLACGYSLLILCVIGGVLFYSLISNEADRMADAHQHRIDGIQQHHENMRQQNEEARRKAMDARFQPNQSITEHQNVGVQNGIQSHRSPIYAPIDQARQRLRDKPEQAFQGNSPEAEKIAEYVAVQLSVVKSLVLSNVEEETESEFRVWCQLSDRRCAILIEAKGYQELDKSAKNALKNTAWDISQRGVKDHIDEGKELAVSIHGDDGVFKTYIGLVREGEPVPPTDHPSDLMLVRFFQSSSITSRPKTPMVKSEPRGSGIPEHMTRPPNFGKQLHRPPGFPNRPQIPGFPTRARGMGRAITDQDVIAPGQKLLAEWGNDQWAVEAIAIQGNGIKIHWVGWSEGFQEVKPKSTLFIATETELKKARTQPGSAPPSFRNRNVSSLKSLRDIKEGDTVKAKLSTHWLPVKVLRIEDEQTIHVHWESFDEKFDESIPLSRLGR